MCVCLYNLPLVETLEQAKFMVEKHGRFSGLMFMLYFFAFVKTSASVIKSAFHGM